MQQKWDSCLSQTFLQGLGRCVRVSPRLRVYEAPTQLLVLQISQEIDFPYGFFWLVEWK